MTRAVCPSCSKEVGTIKGAWVNLYENHHNDRGELCWRSRCPVLPCYMVPAGKPEQPPKIDDVIFTQAEPDKIVRLLLAEMDIRWE